MSCYTLRVGGAIQLRARIVGKALAVGNGDILLIDTFETRGIPIGSKGVMEDPMSVLDPLGH